ncbi:anthranilate synthase component 1 [Candidatus Blochmannia ocreatus (nom. nud.)]|uniref:Anthranilate synthase component 1 n=1 Tax=Candidatus Blochmannia ocreatus (nom. nud.) TaxID=251538 RepID=A0ABY4SU63_9ENTR|nr:anthranilate synthase component 1 [Candidatus Blochmannia ocreatus]URJ24924.1 anthranilate synthase component 1 [Candidatus Blochmannia ocreatus]
MDLKKNQIECLTVPVQYHANPTTVFNQLCNKRNSTLLLESSEINKKYNIESMMIIDSALRITAYGTTVTIHALTQNGASLLPILKKTFPNQIRICSNFNTIKLIFPTTQTIMDEDTRLHAISIFDSLRTLLKILQSPKNHHKSIFLGGLFSYDLISCFEHFPNLTNSYICPDFCFYLAETLLIFNHKKYTSFLQSTIFSAKNTLEKQRLQNRIKQLSIQLRQEPKTIPFKKIRNMKLHCHPNDAQYKKIIENIQYSIRTGEILQAVPSRRFFLPCPSPLAAYHVLKQHNPSPYMFFMQDSIFTLFGTSPESSLKYNANTRQIEIHPIAGTRARAFCSDGSLDTDADNRVELEMRLNHKELSEHLMLVDLARNDLARVCTPGSRYVADLLKVDKYSYVMHLVSKVIGELRPDLDALHAYRACMNMGTLTGAPKTRAMQIIYETEGVRRNTYGGAIGYLTGSGNLDTCIIIRSAYVTKQIATIQAGAGVVIDSIPQEEINESCNKARAVLRAIAIAHDAEEIF